MGEGSGDGARDAAPHWLLTAAERGNPATTIDAEHADRQAWTAGNRVTVHIDGAAYFARLYELLSGLAAGDRVYLTGWRIDATRQLDGPGSDLGPLLVRLAHRRGHPRVAVAPGRPLSG